MPDILHLLQFVKETLQLIQVLDLQGCANEGHLFATDISADRGHVHANIRDNRGNIENETRAVVSCNQDRCQVALLVHTVPTHRDQAFALALAVTTNILAISAVDDCALAAADETNDLITWQRIATV